MHRKHLRKIWTAAALLALGIAGSASAPAAVAQDPKAPMGAAVSDKGGAITITIGGQVRFQMKNKKRIKEAFNENERVLQVLPDAADPTALVLRGASAGTSKLDVTDVDGGKESYLVIVQRDMELFKNLIRKTVPTASVDVTPIGDSGTSIILTGYAVNEADRDNIAQLARALGLTIAVNNISVGGGGMVPHVQLDLTIAKVDRTRARSRGASFIFNGGTASVGSVLGGLGAFQPGVVGAGAVNGLGLGVQPVATQVIPGAGANLIAGYTPGNLNVLLAALKVEGLAKLVSAPSVVTQSGQQADFLVGGQVPVISSAAGINGPGVTYRPVGTELQFLPVVYGNGKIHLTVSPRVTQVNNALALPTGFGTSPGFDEQRMSTQIIVEPGQTIAIGGLIQTTQQGTVTKIPHLGDIPYLGALFSFATQQEQETEVVILLTPRLVDPADCSQSPKALPGAESRKPDDFEFYLETILEAPRGQRPIWTGHQYTPAWKSAKSAGIYPCYGNGGDCNTGRCATPAAPVAPAVPVPVAPARPVTAPAGTSSVSDESPIRLAPVERRGE